MRTHARKPSKIKEEPLSPGHAAYFSPYSIADPLVNRVAGMVSILAIVTEDDGVVLFNIRNVDNGHVCVAFWEELEEPW